MKKWLALLCALVMVFSLAACSSTPDTSTPSGSPSSDGSEPSDNTAKGTFTVGFDQNFPPYGYIGDDGEFTGFDLELAAEVAKRLNLELKLHPVDWDAKDMELSSGVIDCIWNGFTITGREDEYTWSDPYMDNNQVFVTTADSGITSFADLSGKTVAVQVDSTAQKALDKEENAELKASIGNLTTVPDYNTAFMDLEAGAVDAIAMDEGVAKFQIAGRGEEFLILEQVLAPEQYAVGFNKGNTELRDQVQGVLMEMVEDGTFASISQKWFGEDVCILGQ